MKATRALFIASAMTLGVGGLTLACKPANSDISTSEVKDFAFSATAANFAVLFGSGANGPQDAVDGDIMRYKNHLSTGYLGKFEIAMADAAPTRAAVLAAFQGIAAKSGADSSLFVSYSGTQTDGKFKVADGEVSLDDIVAALGGKHVARFYLMNDSAGNKKGVFLTRGSRAAPLLGEIVEFNGFSTAGAKSGGAYNGRLSAEFTGVTDKALVMFTQNHQNPTLGSFYNAVVAGTKAAAIQPTEWYVSDQKLLNQVVFNAATFPPTNSQPLNLAAAAAGINVPDGINLALTKPDGTVTSLKEVAGSAKAIVLKIATKWCKPCAQMSARLERNAQFQAKLKSGEVAFAEIIAVPKTENDGQDVTASLTEWQTRLTEADPGVAQAAMSHSFGVDKHIAELTAETLNNMVPGQATDHCPFMVLLGDGGKVLAGSAQAPNEVAVLKALGIKAEVPAPSNAGAGADHQATDESMKNLFQGAGQDTNANESGNFELK